MTKKARLLIADVPAVQSVLTEALQGYDLFAVGTTQGALRLLAENGFDMIICGIHFDDSRMIELFQAVRKDPRHKDIPLIAFRAIPAEHEELLRDSVTTLGKTLGVNSYIELDAYVNSPDRAASLRKAIEASLPPDKVLATK